MMLEIPALLRVKQWAKNLFLFVPAFFAQHPPEGDEFSIMALGFLAFSLGASTIYILNDLKDAKEDQLHPIKKNRPIASGKIKRKYALLVAAALFLSAIYLSFQINTAFMTILGLYLIMNFLYTLKLKEIAILDISIIAFGFLLRILAGGEMLDIPISKWLLLMTFLLALMMALGKRRDDVIIHLKTGKMMRKALKGYNLAFLNNLIVIVSAVTIVCYIMYSVSEDVALRLGSDYVFLNSIFVILGIMRYLQIIFVKEQSGNPTEILWKDHFLQIIILLWCSTFGLLLYF